MKNNFKVDSVQYEGGDYDESPINNRDDRSDKINRTKRIKGGATGMYSA